MMYNSNMRLDKKDALFFAVFFLVAMVITVKNREAITLADRLESERVGCETVAKRFQSKESEIIWDDLKGCHLVVKQETF